MITQKAQKFQWVIDCLSINTRLFAKVDKVILVTFACFFLGAPLAVTGEEGTPNEYRVKAAYLLNFAKFVEWPPVVFSGSDAPIVLCILGKDPFGDTFDSIKGKLVNGRNVRVSQLKDVRGSKACHILFVSASERDSLPNIFSKLKQSKILVAGDVQDFAAYGGVIGFVIKDKRIGFEINVDAAKRAGITISSKLLSMAKIVRDSPVEEKD